MSCAYPSYEPAGSRSLPHFARSAGALLVAMLLPIAASATEPPFDSERASRTPLVVVTANRHEVLRDAVLGAVVVIDREAIDQAATTDVLVLLQRVAGIDIVRGGPLGQQTSVFLRGGNSNHALVLIDGVRVASANTGAFAFEHLDPAQIERIEILRGPRAALYGSDAMGGVIQIFTRRPHALGLRGGVGSDGLAKLSVEAGHRGERVDFGAGLSGLSYDGYSAQNERGFSFDPDADGLQQRAANLHAGWQLDDDNRLGLVASGDREIVEFDQGRSFGRAQRMELGWDGRFNADWQHRLGISAARDSLSTPAFGNDFVTRRTGLVWHHVWSPADQLTFSGGVDLLREAGRLDNRFADATVFDESRSNAAVYGAAAGKVGGFQYEASLRRDDSDVYGVHVSHGIAIGFEPAQDWSLHASWADAFRAPNFNELYSPGFDGLFAGNPTLAPESSRTLEVGGRWAARSSSVAITTFRSEIDDLIMFSGPGFSATNIDRARVEGLELESDHRWCDWQLTTALTWQRPRDDAGRPLLRRPDRKAFVSAQRAVGANGRIAVEGFAASERADFGGSLGGYGTLAAVVGYAVSPNLDLSLRLDNALDNSYEPAAGFNGVPRQWLFTVDFKPDK